VNAWDPDGLRINTDLLNSDDASQVTSSLTNLTGRSYGIDENGDITAGDLINPNGSKIADDFINEAIQSSQTFNLISKNRNSRVVLASVIGIKGSDSDVNLDFADIKTLKNRKVGENAMGLGTILIHEIAHKFIGTTDPTENRSTTTGSTVDFVNTIRDELGLPIRAFYSDGSYSFAFIETKSNGRTRTRRVRFKNKK
jgi:hypothetical protein